MALSPCRQNFRDAPPPLVFAFDLRDTFDRISAS